LPIVRIANHFLKEETSMRFIQVRQFRLTAAAVALAILGLATVCHADSPRNQIVKHWQKFKPGSSATLAATVTAGNYSVQMEKKDKLIAVNGDQVTIETTVSTNIGGQPHANPPVTQTIGAGNTQGDWTEVGHETIEAAGKKFDCTVVEGKSTVPARGGAPTDSKARLWVADEVPGGIVQLKVSANGHDITYLLSAYEVK
jgi:hypothetical protein